MKVFGIFLIAACVVSLVALVIIPKLDDGDGIRASIAQALFEDETFVHQASGMTISLWPRPTVTLEDVRFGKAEESWLRASSMEGSISFENLLRGRISFDKVLFVEADLLLNGSEFLLSTPKLFRQVQEIRAEPGRILMTRTAGIPEALDVEWFTVRRTDEKSAAVEGKLVLADENGAEFEGVIGIEQDQVFRGRIQLTRGDVQWTYNGTFFPGRLSGGIDENQIVTRGEVSLEVPGLQALLPEVSSVFSDGKISASGKTMISTSSEGISVQVSNLEIQAGVLDITGALDLRPGWIEVVLSANRLDLGDIAMNDLRTDAKSLFDALEGSLSEGVDGRLLLFSNFVRLGGQQIRDGALRLHAEKGVLRIGNLAVELPGGANLVLAEETGRNGDGDLFKGDFILSVSNLRRFAEWAGINLKNFRNDRLHSLDLQGKFTLSNEEWSLNGFEAGLDTVHFLGSISRPAGGGGRLAVSLEFADLSPGNYFHIGTEEGASGEASLMERLLFPLSDLSEAGFDMKLSANQLHLDENLVREISLLCSIDADEIVLREIHVGDFAGTSFDLAGILALPFLEGAGNARIQGKTDDAHELLRVLGVPFKIPDQMPAAASWEGNLEGGNGRFDVVLGGEAFGALLSARGSLGGTLREPTVNLQVEARRNTVDENPGAFRILGEVSGGSDSFSLGGVKILAGGTDGEGEGILSFSGPRPRLEGEIKFFNLDSTFLFPTHGGDAKKGNQGWSSNPLPLSLTEELDVDLDFLVDIFSLDGTEVRDMRGRLLVDEQEISITDFWGRLGTGWIRGSGGLRIGSNPGGQLKVRVSNAQIPPFRAKTGLALENTFLSGVVEVNATGRSFLTLAGSLEGSGWITLSDGTLALPDKNLDSPLALYRIKSEFAVQQGVLLLEKGTAEMADLTGSITGEISVVDRTTDVKARLRPEDGDEGSPTEVRISGPWEALRGRFTMARSLGE